MDSTPSPAPIDSAAPTDPGLEKAIGGHPIPMRIRRVGGQSPSFVPPSQRVGRPFQPAAPSAALPEGFGATLTGAPTQPAAASTIAQARALMSAAVQAMHRIELELPALLESLPEGDAALLAFDLAEARAFAVSTTTALDTLRAS